MVNKGFVCTIFKNISATSTPYHKEVTVILERIRSGQDLSLINQIRLEPDKTKRNQLKKELPSICFSGKFRHRSAAGLIQHSGLIALDFDNFETTEELSLYRKALIESKEKGKFTFALFTSPSGKGLKCIVKIPATQKDHKAYFNALKEFYNDPHFDIACSDICRVCYSSFDSDLYFNPEAEEWIEMEVNEHYNLSDSVPVLKLKTPVSIIQNIQKWFDKKYTLVKGENVNSSLFILASAFNDFGLPKHETESYMRNKYGSKKNEKEVELLVKSAYKKEGGTKFFEDKQRLDLLERLIKSGGSDKKKIYKKLHDEGSHSEEEVDSAIKSISDSMPISEFWYFDDRGKCRIRNYKFKGFLEQNGFYKYYPEGAENFIFIRIENNMIESASCDSIKDFVLGYLQEQSSLDPFETMSGSAKMFRDDYLNLIDKAEVSFYEDTIDTGVVYFKNGAALVKKGEDNAAIELIDYLNLNGYVWKKHIINRDYSNAPFTDCVFDRFITLIAGKDKDKVLSIKSTIGYLMHSFKTSANNKAVVFNDEMISDNPNGGAGKGILCAAVGYMKRMVVLDGKTFSSDKSFAYQTVGADTQLLVYDDVARNFQFEKIFSVITEGITLEKKNKDAVKLPVGKSPKIIINTNYTIGGVGGSYDRRKWEIELSSYFNSDHTPLMEFKHMLFDEWSPEEWQKFDCLMIDCLRIYLENGLVKQEYTNLAERKFIKETSFDFHEWVTDEPLPMNVMIIKEESYNKFVQEYPDYKHSKWFSQKKLYQWLDVYGKYKGYKVQSGKSVGGKWLCYISENNTTEEIKEIVEKFNDEDEYVF